MKGLAPLFLGIFGTFAFSWLGLTVIPTWQIGHLNPNPTKRERTFIHVRNPECLNRGNTFTQQTAVSIAILNKSAPITSPTISRENGALAAARRAITFLIVQSF